MVRAGRPKNGPLVHGLELESWTGAAEAKAVIAAGLGVGAVQGSLTVKVGEEVEEVEDGEVEGAEVGGEALEVVVGHDQPR